MAKLKRLSPRKEPVQERSIELRKSILEAATYILKKNGASGFTTNKVAERAGVNIASLYQYYPNKEALLFHLVELKWESTFSTAFPVLKDKTKSPGQRLKLFIAKFYEHEVEDSPLKQAMAGVGVLVENSKEYEALTIKGEKAFLDFLADALPATSQAELRKKAQFILHLITSYSECMAGDDWKNRNTDAEIMSAMIGKYFRIGE